MGRFLARPGARVLEGERGWLDVLVGGRYMYLGVDFDMQPDYAAAGDISSSVVNQAADTVSGQVGSQVGKKADDKKAEPAKAAADERVLRLVEGLGLLEAAKSRQLPALVSSIELRMLEELGVELQYPTLEAGLAAMAQETD